MALRIKSHWHDEKSDRSLEEIGSALAYNGWRIAKDKTINLHGKNFFYRNEAQRMAVLTEYLIFQVQVVDRMAHSELQLDDDARRTLIVGFVKKLAMYMQENSPDLFGPGDYGTPFIAALNDRSGEYADFSFDDDGPSYSFFRHLGHEIQQIMGEQGENRWVIDQVMDRDAPDIAKKVMRTVVDLFE